MDVKQRILENVRKQGIINGRLQKLQEEGDGLGRDLQRLGGQMELLGDLVEEEFGMNLEEMIKSDEEFKMMIADASKEGTELSVDTTDKTQASKKLRSVTPHKGNKTVQPPPQEPVPEVVRKRSPTKIVITDGPPDDKHDEDDKE